MVNRIVLGDRNGTMGLWISRPGFDVMTASEDNMLLSTSRVPFQVIQSGVASFTPSNPRQVVINFPNRGYFPFIVTNTWSLAGLIYDSHTQARLLKDSRAADDAYFTFTYRVFSLEKP